MNDSICDTVVRLSKTGELREILKIKAVEGERQQFRN